MQSLEARLLGEIQKIAIIDPHSHIDPRRPTARDIDDLLGYHYYTELAHSAGLDKAAIGPSVAAEDRVRALVDVLPRIENTVQYTWFEEIVKNLLCFPAERIDRHNCDALMRHASDVMARDTWEGEVLFRSNLERVFLTSEFDDPLEGFDRQRYVPCLRLDDLVFSLGQPRVVERLRQASGVDVGNAASLIEALRVLFERFVSRGARACAISLPPDFAPGREEAGAVDPFLRRLLAGGELAAGERLRAERFVFWSIAVLAESYRLPFDLMIGVNRGVYAGGVYQGRDLFNRLTSLHQFRELFNAFPDLVFPVSILDSSQNPELVAYAWIFPNVVTHGHWWYANIPALIEPDVRQRLQAVPRTKQIGYYSDMYKLEFGLPKFNMYRRILARALAVDFVVGRSWSEERAVDLARDVLRGNVERIFYSSQRGE